MTDKKELRKYLKELEVEFLATGRAEEESHRIFKAVAADEKFLAADTVLLYMAIGGEVLTAGFIDYCVSLGKRVVLPKVEGASLSLRLYSPESLVNGYKGILEPSDCSQIIEPQDIELAIIPGLAFAPESGVSLSSRACEVSSSGDWIATPAARNDGQVLSMANGRYYRMGRGGGFYDRLIPALTCPIFAVAYPFRVLDSIPLDEWDRPVNRLFH